jgi:hypothetical protein
VGETLNSFTIPGDDWDSDGNLLDCVQSRLGDVLSDTCRHASQHDGGIPLTRRSLIFSHRPSD